MTAVIEKALGLARNFPPDAAGELLSYAVFGEEPREMELSDGFEPAAGDSLSLDERTALLGCFAKDADEISNIRAHRHKCGLLVAWHWDGDCAVIYSADGLLLENGDFMHDREWTKAGTKDDWVTGYWDRYVA